MTPEQIDWSRKAFEEWASSAGLYTGRDEHGYEDGDAMWAWDAWQAAMDRFDLIQARAYVIGSGRASISALQRKLKIGYNHAARLHEALEREGVVSPPDPETGRRTVLIAGEGS